MTVPDEQVASSSDILRELWNHPVKDFRKMTEPRDSFQEPQIMIFRWKGAQLLS